MQNLANLRLRLRPGKRLMTVAAVALAIISVCAACGGEPDFGNASAQPDTPPNSTAETFQPQPEELNDLQSRAREVLASRLAVPAATLTLISDEAVQWSDASLGCPREGMGYAQVITPGHRMKFRHNGHTYEVHTAAPDSQQEPVSCEGGTSY